MKIKYILLSSLLCHLLFMLPSFAFSLHPEYDLFLGAPLYWYQYREPTFMKDRGVFYGIESSIAHYDPIMLKAALTLTYGHVDYTSKKTGRVHNNNDIRIETRTLAGLPIFSMKNALYIPYFGFGYRFFRDDSSGRVSTTGASGYNRESNYLYLPLGIKWWKNLSETWQIRTTLEVDPLWHGFQESDISQLDGTNKQDSGYGFNLSLKLIHGLNGINYYIQPFFHYWNIKRSEMSIDSVTFDPDIVMTAVEPHNITRQAGIVVGILL